MPDFQKRNHQPNFYLDQNQNLILVCIQVSLEETYNSHPPSVLLFLNRAVSQPPCTKAPGSCECAAGQGAAQLALVQLQSRFHGAPKTQLCFV